MGEEQSITAGRIVRVKDRYANDWPAIVSFVRGDGMIDCNIQVSRGVQAHDFEFGQQLTRFVSSVGVIVAVNVEPGHGPGEWHWPGSLSPSDLRAA